MMAERPVPQNPLAGGVAEEGISGTVQELSRLSQLADHMRAQLLQLQHELVLAHRDSESNHAAKLLEANSKLVQAALLAQTEAATALESLEALQGPRPTDPPAAHPPPAAGESSATQAIQKDLREANTQLMVAALQAQTQEADARENHRRQIQYMAMVAHELRNPLGPIRFATGLLSRRGPEGSPSLPRLQAIIERQVVQIARLVEDLLEGSRIASGKLRLEFVDVDIGDILDQAVLSSRHRMEERGQAVFLDLEEGALPMRGDPVRLLQVFCNLLDNASKYTPAGGEIRMTASRSEDMLTVTVSDSGVGISPLAITKIFDLFEQDDHDVEHENRGLGIGLAVVRELVDSHGGSVAAHSEGKGKGSEFVVTLPMGSREPG